MTKFEKSKRLPVLIEADWVNVKRHSVGGSDLKLDLWCWDDGAKKRTFRVALDDSAIYQIKCAIVAHSAALRERAQNAALMPSEEAAKAVK